MIDVNTITYSMEAAAKRFAELPDDFSNFSVTSPDAQKLRGEFLEINSRNQGKSEYAFDVSFALDMFVLLKDTYHMTNITAISEDFWRWLQLEIIPDVVIDRHGKKENRFYSERRRIWLRQIWWYINLSWQGDKSSTENILKKNTTDTIGNLVERIGVGYDVAVYREIMKQYAPFSGNREVFRRVMILHMARVELVAPELIEGGVEEYVRSLFGEINVD
ncbi:CDS_ID OB3337 [Weissella confusa]|uniref:hypothetical protein n=1 Tax=Weissella confusa TaxID=1583 RepID=UPI000989A057|nr:hypothetical protein [Weissella confusa]SJX70521.1 CDS_ID OB3337 [Weissella confusa]